MQNAECRIDVENSCGIFFNNALSAHFVRHLPKRGRQDRKNKKQTATHRRTAGPTRCVANIKFFVKLSFKKVCAGSGAHSPPKKGY